MNAPDSIAKLTEREKVCLRQWLQHKSAKEIAADLGISHHAVEKRLKMARTKLRATSSLEAARMLVDAEGYGQAVAHSADLVLSSGRLPDAGRSIVLGATIMILIAALFLGLHAEPATVSHTAPAVERQLTPGAIPSAGTEAALRSLVAGLANGSPDYGKIAPQFGQIVRRDLPMTHPLFSSMGELRSVTFLGRDETGADLYNLVFAKGGAIMSASLDSAGRMAGGILRPLGQVGKAAPAQTDGTEAALRLLVAGLSSGSPDYGKLSPRFAETVRRDMPTTHPLFSSLGELKSATFLGRGEMGDDVYQLVFTKGGMIMSASLDSEGRNAGGMFVPVAPPAR